MSLFAGCSDSPQLFASSGPPDDIALSVSVAPSAITPGDTARITLTVTNRSRDPVTLHFSTGCQLLYTISGPDGNVVVPEGGSWICAQVLTTLELAAGESRTQVHTWTGQRQRWVNGTQVSEPLPLGTYSVVALLADGSGRKAGPVQIELL